MADVSMICGDARCIPLSDESVDCVVTSPPYWGLRDYGIPSQLGLEKTPEDYTRIMVAVFREVNRVLRKDGTLWLNMGDTYNGGNKGNSGPIRPGDKQATNAGSWGTRRRDSGTLSPSRSGGCSLKVKDMIGIPWMLAFGLRADGWYLRSDIIWSKPNPMPESVADRPTKSHEYIFLFSKSERYHYNQQAVLEPVTGNAHARGDGVNPKAIVPVAGCAQGPGSHEAIDHAKPKSSNGSKFTTGKTAHHGNVGNGPRTGYRIKQNESFSGAVNGLVEARNKRSVWSIPSEAFPEAHFATFPKALVKPCILAGCPAGGVVLDPFAGSGTTLLVARELQCHGIGIELNPAYIEIAKRRLRQQVLAFHLDEAEKR